MDALAFLDKTAKSKRQPIYALSGDEEFLKRLCKAVIRDAVLGDADPEFALTVYSGDKLEFSTVRNDLDTLPFLAHARLVFVDDADKFVTEHRPALERYAEKPSDFGVLVPFAAAGIAGGYHRGRWGATGAAVTSSLGIVPMTMGWKPVVPHSTNPACGYRAPLARRIGISPRHPARPSSAARRCCC